MKPPEDLDGAEREAWKDGYNAALKGLSDYLASEREEQREDKDICPDCGAQMITGWGGPQCPECGT